MWSDLFTKFSILTEALLVSLNKPFIINILFQVSGSSPDLVSSRHVAQAATYADIMATHPAAHRTYANLAALTHATQMPYRVSAPEPIYENIPLPWREEQHAAEMLPPPPAPEPKSPTTTVHASDTLNVSFAPDTTVQSTISDISASISSSVPVTDTSVSSSMTTATGKMGFCIRVFYCPSQGPTVGREGRRD